MIVQVLGCITNQIEETEVPQTISTTQENGKEKLYYIKQKITGVLLIVLGAFSIPISDGDGTAFLFMLFIGLAMIGTKEKMLMEKEEE